jgi:hypothetical protein
MLEERRWQGPYRPGTDRHDHASLTRNALPAIHISTCLTSQARPVVYLYELPEIGFAARSMPAGAGFAPRLAAE